MAENLKKDFQKNSLKEARIEKKLTLENIALELRISVGFLRHSLKMRITQNYLVQLMLEVI